MKRYSSALISTGVVALMLGGCAALDDGTGHPGDWSIYKDQATLDDEYCLAQGHADGSAAHASCLERLADWESAADRERMERWRRLNLPRMRHGPT